MSKDFGTSPGDYTVATESREKMAERVDARVKFHAEILAKLDAAVLEFRIDKNGKVVFPDKKIQLEEAESVAMAPVNELIKEKSIGIAEELTAFREQAGVTDAVHVLGAAVIVYDSSKGTPDFFGFTMEDSTRGFLAKNKVAMGLIGVDLNPKLRKDDVEPSVSLAHELHHYLRELSNLALCFDKEVPFASGSGMQQVVEKKKGKAYRSSWERVGADKEKYESLTGREFPSEPARVRKYAQNIEFQQAFLDELHSSILQKKISWFSAGSNLYSTKKKVRTMNWWDQSPKILKQLKIWCVTFKVCLRQTLCSLICRQDGLRKRLSF